MDEAEEPRPASEADRDPAEDALGGMRHQHLVQDASFRGLVEEVADGDEDIPVGARDGAEERKALADLDVEARVEDSCRPKLRGSEPVDATERDDAGVGAFDHGLDASGHVVEITL